MKEREYLLTVLMEELAELQKELSKCIRFGPHHRERPGDLSNFERANIEYSDVDALVTMLKAHGVELTTDERRKERKVFRTLDYMEFSRKCGVLE